MRKTLVVALPLTALMILLFLPGRPPAIAQDAATDDPYSPIPKGFDFPAKQEALLDYLKNSDVSNMRLHAWSLWAGINQSVPGGKGPIWETWYSQQEVFRAGAAPQGERKPTKRFNPPRQHKPGSGATPQAEGQALMSFVLMNRETRTHIRSNELHMAAKLNSLKSAGAVPEFPAESVALKMVWWHVKKNGITPMPIWDNDPVDPNGPNDLDTWKRVVAIDPVAHALPEDAKINTLFNGKAYPDSHCVSMRERFYYFPITQDVLDNMDKSIFSADQIQVGDYAVLVCCHVTTKEIPNWVWATFWWHDWPDALDSRNLNFGADKPQTVQGVWRNFRMDVAYDTDIPADSSGGAHVCFNPWLEARFGQGLKGASGITSNCMTCHQRAVYPDGSFLPVTRGGLKSDDPLFKDQVKTDFLWSIVFLGNN